MRLAGGVAIGPQHEQLSHLLVIKPERRYVAADALSHPWLIDADESSRDETWRSARSSAWSGDGLWLDFTLVTVDAHNLFGLGLAAAPADVPAPDALPRLGPAGATVPAHARSARLGSERWREEC